MRSAKEHHTRPAVDPLFRSAAVCHGQKVIGVVLTGRLDDGTAGLHAIKRSGGVAVVQAPEEAEQPSMPRTTMQAVDVDYCVRLGQMGALLVRLVSEVNRTMATSVPEPRVVHEHAAGFGPGSAVEHLQAIGEVCSLTCPDCHGVLWRITAGGPSRYRCHTGHAFSALSLNRTLMDSREEALWSALRATEERIMLLRAGETATASGATVSSEVKTLQDQAQVLRHMIRTSVPPAAD